MTPQARLLGILLKLSLVPKEERGVGICLWVSVASVGMPTNDRRELNFELRRLMRAWPDALPNDIYIVPMERGNMSLYDATYAYNNLPRWTKGPYAELRCELLQWMIKELTNA
ncbi:MAG: hypothetical protein ACRDC4_03765 [Plesiomonas sp.]